MADKRRILVVLLAYFYNPTLNSILMIRLQIIHVLLYVTVGPSNSGHFITDLLQAGDDM